VGVCGKAEGACGCVGRRRVRAGMLGDGGCVRVWAEGACLGMWAEGVGGRRVRAGQVGGGRRLCAGHGLKKTEGACGYGWRVCGKTEGACRSGCGSTKGACGCVGRRGVRALVHGGCVGVSVWGVRVLVHGGCVPVMVWVDGGCVPVRVWVDGGCVPVRVWVDGGCGYARCGLCANPTGTDAPLDPLPHPHPPSSPAQSGSPRRWRWAPTTWARWARATPLPRAWRRRSTSPR
jgi:hypothetical protein